MKTEARLPFIMRFMLCVSLFGLLTTLLMVVYPPNTREDTFLRGPLIGSTFIAICAAGIAASLSTRKCSTSFDTHVSEGMSRQGSKIVSAGSKAHHPDCGRFSAHTIRFNQVLHCAACTGLVLGASFAVVISAAHFFFGFSLQEFSLLYVAIGQLGPVLGFIQFKFKGWSRFAANGFFVIGTSLILIGIDQHVGSFFADIYVMALVVFWIMTRITISQWDHSRICLTCNYQCKRKTG
jgi:hypothetical protein